MNKIFPLVQIIFITASVVYWQTTFQFIEEADTRFAMNLGRYILEHGFPHVDPFTIHENLQLVAQQWLSGIFFWEAYKNFGVNGLAVLDYFCGAAAVVIYWRLCLTVSGGNKILSAVMAFFVGMAISSMIVPRPQIFSTPLLVGEVFFLEKFTRTGKTKFLLPLPFVSLAMINFHAALWMMSLAICLPFLFVRNVRHAKFLLAAMAAIVVCGLINPYGVDAMTYVLRSYGVELINSRVAEMFTPSAHDFRGKVFYLTEAAIIFSSAKVKTPWRYVFLSGGIIFLSIMHSRNFLLFHLLATLPIVYACRNFVLEKIFSAPDGGRPENNAMMILMLMTVLFVNTASITLLMQDGLDKLSAPIEIIFFAAMAFVLYNLLILRVDGRILHPKLLPRKILSLTITAVIVCGIYSTTLDTTKKNPPQIYTPAIEFLLRSERPENILLYVDQSVGGLAGEFGIRYYIDSRSEVFLDVNNGRKNIFEEYIDFKNGKIFYKDFFGRYDFTHIIITSNDPFIFNQLSRDRDFRVIYESEHLDGYDVVRCKIFVNGNRQ